MLTWFSSTVQWAGFTALVLEISLLHYYTEGFTWQKGTPHRRAIVMS